MGEIGSGGGSSYPTALDTNNTPEVNSPNAGKTKARAEVANDLASGQVAIETELGTNPAGTKTDVKTYLQTEHGADGTHDATKVVMIAGAQTITGDKTFIDNAFSIADNGDNTKKLAFETSNITTSTTRTITVPDADMEFDFGTYTPSLTGVANVDNVSNLASSAHYSRIGNRVTLSAGFTVDATAADTFTSFRVSLPIASTFSSTGEANGSGTLVGNPTNLRAVNVKADTTNNEILIECVPYDATFDEIRIMCMYEVI